MKKHGSNTDNVSHLGPLEMNRLRLDGNFVACEKSFYATDELEM